MKNAIIGLLVLAGLPASCSSGGPEEPSERFLDGIVALVDRWDRATAEGDGESLHLLANELTRRAESRGDWIYVDLENPAFDRRMAAIFALGFVRTVAARDTLLGMTLSDDVSTRCQAAAALGLQGRETTPVKPLLTMLTDPDPRVRQAALTGLFGLVSPGGDRGILSYILPLLDDESREVRSEAIVLFSRLALPVTTPVLIEKGLSDPFPPVRRNAAIALREIGSAAEEAVPSLIERLRDEDPSVVLSAWHALREITGEEIDRVYDRWRNWHEEQARQMYECRRHPETASDRPGSCGQCGEVMRLRDVVEEIPEGKSGSVPKEEGGS